MSENVAVRNNTDIHYIDKKWAETCHDELCSFLNKVDATFSQFPNYNGVTIDDCSYKTGVHVGLLHKEITTHIFVDYKFLHYSFDNERECIESLLKDWTARDTDNAVKSYKDFIANGEKYGWD